MNSQKKECPHCGDGLLHADFDENMNEILYCANDECPIAPEYQYSITEELKDEE